MLDSIALLLRGLLAVVLLGGANTSFSEASSLQRAIKHVDAFVQQHMKEAGTPGIQVGVTSAEQLLWQQSYGFADIKTGSPVTEQTLFQIGSITKSFTAIAVLQLASADGLDLHAPVTRYLPWFSVQSEYQPITAHHLLTHTAGIPANRDDLPPGPYTTWALREQSAAWAPGSRFYYSNIGYQVLHVLFETAADAVWAERVQAGILTPLGMRHTETAISPSMRDRQAVAYVSADPDLPPHPSRPLVEAPFLDYSIGDGAIASTATDMSRYARMLLNNGLGPDGPVLSKDAFEAFSAPHANISKGESYGYGIDVRNREGHRQLRHSGGMVGFSAMLVTDLDTELGVVALLNGPGDPEAVADFIAATFDASLHERALPPMPASKNPALVDNAEDYAGVFASMGKEQVRVVAHDKTLVLMIEDLVVPLERHGKDAFYSVVPGFDRYLFRFDRADDGQVVDLSHGPAWYFNDRYGGPREFTPAPDQEGHVGRYVSMSPWFPGFSVFLRRGALWTVSSGGGETDALDETELTPVGEGCFRPEPEPTPERVCFDELVDGRSWRARWSGHRFYRDRFK